MKPKHFLQRRTRCISFGDALQEMWDRYREISRENFRKKRKLTGFIDVPGSKFCEAEGNLSTRSCLKDDVINYATRIGQCPPRKVKDTNI